MSGDLQALVHEAYYKPRRQRTLKTHCVHGHELTDDNLVHRRRPEGGTRRDCRICFEARAAQYRAKARAERAKGEANHMCNVAGLEGFLARRRARGIPEEGTRP